MAKCIIAHIPPRLHWDDRPKINEFFQDELLYRRCNDPSIEDPFTVSLYDISINRQGPLDDQLGDENDVLFNIENDEFILYEGMGVFTMIVRKIDVDFKTYTYKDNEQPYRMELLHDPLDCNYFHAIFRIYYSNGEEEIIVDRNNYNDTLGQRISAIKKLRSRIRAQLVNMRYRKEVTLNSE